MGKEGRAKGGRGEEGSGEDPRVYRLIVLRMPDATLSGSQLIEIAAHPAFSRIPPVIKRIVKGVAVPVSLRESISFSRLASVR